MPYPEVSLRLSGSLPPVGRAPGDADALTEPRVMRLRLPPVGRAPGGALAVACLPSHGTEPRAMPACLPWEVPSLPWARAPGDAHASYR